MHMGMIVIGNSSNSGDMVGLESLKEFFDLHTNNDIFSMFNNSYSAAFSLQGRKG